MLLVAAAVFTLTTPALDDDATPTAPSPDPSADTTHAGAPDAVPDVAPDAPKRPHVDVKADAPTKHSAPVLSPAAGVGVAAGVGAAIGGGLAIFPAGVTMFGAALRPMCTWDAGGNPVPGTCYPDPFWLSLSALILAAPVVGMSTLLAWLAGPIAGVDAHDALVAGVWGGAVAAAVPIAILVAGLFVTNGVAAAFGEPAEIATSLGFVIALLASVAAIPIVDGVVTAFAMPASPPSSE